MIWLIIPISIFTGMFLAIVFHLKDHNKYAREMIQIDQEVYGEGYMQIKKYGPFKMIYRIAPQRIKIIKANGEMKLAEVIIDGEKYTKVDF